MVLLGKELDNMKKVIYTCITGEYDNINDPVYVTKNWDYICFTNNPNLTSDVWKIIQIDNSENLDNTRLARKYKLLPHKFLSDYDFSVWVDANITVSCNLDNFSDKIISSHYKIALMTHGYRNCIYAEAAECIRQQKDDPETINAQISRYREEGFPKNRGMVQTGIQFRFHNTPELIQFNEAWFNEVKNGSKRDQLSFNYIAWKQKGFEYVKISHAVLFNSHLFPIKPHNHGW